MIPDDDNAQGGVSIDGPGGLGLRVRGTDYITTLVIIGLAIMIYITWQNGKEAHEYQTQTAAALKNLADTQRETITTLRDSQEETTYLLSLPQARREKLGLEIPVSLRNRLR